MRVGGIVMLLVALAFGIAAAFIARNALESPAPEPQVAVSPPALEMGTLVVASQPVRFGTELSASNLREIAWPSANVPAGAFATVADLMNGVERRVSLAALEPNEPVLATKVTGPGQRASLSALIEDEKRAVSIRVTDVQGVAGFVLPGERVDILLTRMEPEVGGETVRQSGGYTDVLLQNVAVLAVDQLADDRTDQPALAKVVTVEATMEQAQVLSLASAVGQLSLALRRAGYTGNRPARRVSVPDLGGQAGPAATQSDGARVGVVRGLGRTTYTVPSQRQRLIN